MPDLKELETAVTADGKIDATEVANIRAALLADGKIDRDEADTLFRINDTVTNADNDPSWAQLFSELIAAHVLEDEASPGVVSEEEAAYLKEKISADGAVDAAERTLLGVLKAKAQDPVPAALQELFDHHL